MKKQLLLLGIIILNGILSAQTVQKTMNNLPDTGQTSSYTTTFGEDNDYSINVPSFTNNGNGTITDNVTGLMWQQGDSGELTFENGTLYCDNLVLGGFTDWRLPTKEESMSILNLDSNNPALNTTYFPTTTAGYWWSATVLYNNVNAIWVTNAGGGTGPKLKTETISAGGTLKYHARAVRSSAAAVTVTNFSDNNDGTITDNVTGLMWQKSPAATAYTWEQALAFAENLTDASYTDWRLPNIKELVSINSETTNAPSINTTFFPTVAATRYWSSTTQLAPGSTSAWFNDFQNAGITSHDLKTVSHPIICVRGIPLLKVAEYEIFNNNFKISSPFTNQIEITAANDLNDVTITLHDLFGREQQQWRSITCTANQKSILTVKTPLSDALYVITIQGSNVKYSTKILHASTSSK